MIIKTSFTKKENVDSGLALLLIMLILGFVLKMTLLFKLAIVIAVVTMAVPVCIYPFTVFWLNASDLLGKLMSTIILSVIFFIVLCPIALVRKLSGKDSLHLKKFKKSQNSVFTERNHTYSKTDLVNPF